MSDLHISKRLKALLPPLTDAERQQLKGNIESDGEILEPILFWDDGKKNVVVDGMNRFEIARKENLAYPCKSLCFESYEEVELWILNHQLGRRNLLAPAAIRKIRGDLYNRLKRKDAGHGDQRSGGQIDTPIQDAAEEVAEKAGVSASTVKRDGARVNAIASLTKAAKLVAEKATHAEVKKLAKLSEVDQDRVARAVRVRQAGTVSEAIKLIGAKPPKGEDADAERSPRKGKDKPAAKPPRKLDRPACYKRWEQGIGPVVRLVDKIASDAGESNSEAHNAVHRHLDAATAEIAKWMEVEQ